MWICKNCQNQNEENFKFCWSCGHSKSASRKTVRGNTTELTFQTKANSTEKEIPKVEKIEVPVKETEKETPVEIEVRTKEKPVYEDDEELLTKQKADKKAQKEVKPEPQKSNIKEPEIFSTFTSNKDSEKNLNTNNIDWQTEIFTIAIRLIGLYFLLQVILLIPDLLWFIYLIVVKGQPIFTAFPEFFESAQFLFIAKFLFYLILGIYLIASGNLLIRLLPNR